MRLFVGIPVACGEVLGPVRNTLRRLDGVRPVPEGTEHVTLRFFGDLEDAGEVRAIQAAIGSAVAKAPSMKGTVHRLGMFQDPRHAKVVWASLEADGLAEFQEQIVAVTKTFGQPEASRPFVPHITLARCKQPQDLRPLLDDFIGPFWEGELSDLVLYGSQLGPSGPEYEHLASWKLGT